MYGIIDPNTKGDITEITVQKALLERGFTISKPVNSAARYDLVLDAFGHLFKMQIKTAHYCEESGSLSIPLYSTNKLNGKYIKNRYSDSDVELFATAYNDEVYIIPQYEVDGMSTVSLRLSPPKNGQTVGIRYAENYRLDHLLNENSLNNNQQLALQG